MCRCSEKNAGYELVHPFPAESIQSRITSIVHDIGVTVKLLICGVLLPEFIQNTPYLC